MWLSLNLLTSIRLEINDTQFLLTGVLPRSIFFLRFYGCGPLVHVISKRPRMFVFSSRWPMNCREEDHNQKCKYEYLCKLFKRLFVF